MSFKLEDKRFEKFRENMNKLDSALTTNGSVRGEANKNDAAKTILTEEQIAIVTQGDEIRANFATELELNHVENAGAFFLENPGQNEFVTSVTLGDSVLSFKTTGYTSRVNTLDKDGSNPITHSFLTTTPKIDLPGAYGMGAHRKAYREEFKQRHGETLKKHSA